MWETADKDKTTTTLVWRKIQRLLCWNSVPKIHIFINIKWGTFSYSYESKFLLSNWTIGQSFISAWLEAKFSSYNNLLDFKSSRAVSSLWMYWQFVIFDFSLIRRLVFRVWVLILSFEFEFWVEFNIFTEMTKPEHDVCAVEALEEWRGVAWCRAFIPILWWHFWIWPEFEG